MTPRWGDNVGLSFSERIQERQHIDLNRDLIRLNDNAFHDCPEELCRFFLRLALQRKIFLLSERLHQTQY